MAVRPSYDLNASGHQPQADDSDAKLDKTGVLVMCKYRVMFCCRCRREACCEPRTGCSACCASGWTCSLLAVAVVMFFLVAYTDCLFVPLRRLSRPEDADAGFVLSSSPQVLARARAGNISVLSYNIFLRTNFITDDDLVRVNDYKEERMALFLEEKVLDEYDVIALQETWTTLSDGRKGRMVEAARRSGFPYYVRSACKGKWLDAMLLILSRHPITESEERTFTDATGFDALASKGVVRARIRPVFERAAFSAAVKSTDPGAGAAGRCDWDLFNTHMQAGGDPEVRRGQMREMGNFVRDVMLGPGTGPITGEAVTLPSFLAGDFNVNGRVGGRRKKKKGDAVLVPIAMAGGLMGTVEQTDEYSDLMKNLGIPERIAPFGTVIDHAALAAHDAQRSAANLTREERDTLFPPSPMLVLTNLLATDNNGSMPITSPHVPNVPIERSKLVVPAEERESGQSLDYAFYVSGEARGATAGPGVSPGVSPGAYPAPGSAFVDNMDVAGQPFVTLSDHFGVRFVVRCRP